MFTERIVGGVPIETLNQPSLINTPLTLRLTLSKHLI